MLREVAGASLPRIRAVTRVLDDPGRSLLDALEVAQVVALDLPTPAERPDPDDRSEDPLVAVAIAAAGWPDLPTAPRSALSGLLSTMRASGLRFDEEAIVQYARRLDGLARVELNHIGTGDRVTRSADRVVADAVVGMVAYDRLVSAMRALAHASVSIQRSAGADQ